MSKREVGRQRKGSKKKSNEGVGKEKKQKAQGSELEQEGKGIKKGG